MEHMLALAYMARGDFDGKNDFLQKAERHLLSAIKNYPNFEPRPGQDYGRLSISEARVNLSAIYLQMGKWDDAIKYARQAVEDPFYRFPDRAHYNLGLAYYKKDQSLKAINHLKLAVDINRNFPGGYKTLGEIYLEMNRYSEAVLYLQKAIEAYNEYTEAYYLLGLTYQKQNERRLAQKYFKKCHSMDSEDPFRKRCKDFIN